MSDLLTKESFNECNTCAYQESGHILFAYLCGYTCKEVQLIEENNEAGYSSYALIDYGKDSSLASKFTDGHADTDFFKTLPLGLRLESIEVGRRLARIFLGGSVAAAVYKNDGNTLIPLPMQIDLTDLLRVEYIQQVLNGIATDQEDDFIEYTLREALYTLANINIWNTVSDLAGRLLEQKHLDKNDIEECLDEHGLLFHESPLNTDLRG